MRTSADQPLKLLNLGCGSKTSDAPGVINIDWSPTLRIRQNFFFRNLALLFLDAKRLQKVKSLPQNIMVHNLAKGIPFPDNSIDVVYHSHVLEHLDRDIAKLFLLDIKRVLKPKGVLRLVVPDFELLCREYCLHILQCDKYPQETNCHEEYISSILEQSVRKESYGTSNQKPLRRFIENFILGDARKRGETHQWMYDRITINQILKSIDYNEISFTSFDSSRIYNWEKYKLDINCRGEEYKPGSLYVEAVA